MYLTSLSTFETLQPETAGAERAAEESVYPSGLSKVLERTLVSELRDQTLLSTGVRVWPCLVMKLRSGLKKERGLRKVLADAARSVIR